MEHISLNGLDPKRRQDNVFSGCLTLTSPNSDPDCQSHSYFQRSASMKCIPFGPGNSTTKYNENFVDKMSGRLLFCFWASLQQPPNLQYFSQSPIEFVWGPFPVCLLSGHPKFLILSKNGLDIGIIWSYKNFWCHLSCQNIVNKIVDKTNFVSKSCWPNWWQICWQK